MNVRTSAQCRILLVEDAEDARQVFLAAVEPDCSVEVAETGSEALDRLSEDDFDLVVLDLELPDCNGFTVLQMADTGRRGKIPFIIYSALSEVSDFVGRLDRFILVDYLAKPIDVHEIRARVVEALREMSSSATRS